LIQIDQELKGIELVALHEIFHMRSQRPPIGKCFAGTQIDIFQGTAPPHNSTQVFFSPLQSSNLKDTADTRRQQLRHAKAHNVWPQGMEEGSHNLKALEAIDLLPL
jgi:hypothetical protein